MDCLLPAAVVEFKGFAQICSALKVRLNQPVETVNEILSRYSADPFDQFSLWYERQDLKGFARFVYWLQRWVYDVASKFAPELHRINDNAFVITTQTGQGPESRMVLLKSFDSNGFVFYTNYQSDKGKAILENPQVQMLFYEPFPLRQMRIWGEASPVDRQQSRDYWNTRPKGSQVSQAASDQSRPRRPGELEGRINELKKKNKIECPEHWGGFLIRPRRFEFWEGRANRLHDRVIYEKKQEGGWNKFMLQP